NTIEPRGDCIQRSVTVATLYLLPQLGDSTMADEVTNPQSGGAQAQPSTGAPQAAPQQQAPQFTTDASNISTVYTNFCHVSITPEELILDFGLNTQMQPQPNDPIKLSHRVVMNFYTAKRLWNALHFAVSRHESAFGVLELDFQKRARSAQSSTGIRPAGGLGLAGGLSGFQP